MGANPQSQQQLFNLLGQNAALQGAKVGLPGGASFGMVPNAPAVTPGFGQGPLAQKIFNAIDYAAPVFNAINSSDGGGWLGAALGGVGQVHNLKNYNKAQQDARLYQAQLAATERQNYLSDYNRHTGNTDTSVEFAKQLLPLVGAPLLKRAGEYQQDTQQGIDEETANAIRDSMQGAIWENGPPEQGELGPFQIDLSKPDFGMSRYTPQAPQGQQSTFSAGAAQTAISPKLQQRLDLIKQYPLTPTGFQTRRTNNTTVRGQDATSATARRGQDVSAITQKRGQDVAAGTQRRGQDIGLQKAREGNRTKAQIAASNRAVQLKIAKMKGAGGGSGRSQSKLEAAQQLLKQGDITKEQYQDFVLSKETGFPFAVGPDGQLSIGGATSPASSAPKGKAPKGGGKFGFSY
jgi:hypothetical protein